MWDQTSGQQQQQQQQQAASTATTASPSSAIQTQPYSSSGSAPGTSSNVTAPPTKGRGGTNVANTQPRGGPAAAANVRNMRGGANARGRGAVMRGHMGRGQMVRGHVGRGRNPGVRGPAGRSRGSLRRQT